MEVAGGEIRRRLVTIGGQPVVLMSKSHPILQPCFDKQRWLAFANRAALPHALGQEVDEINRGLRFSFNCHTISIGALVGLKAEEWLEGSRSLFTCRNNPAQDLLDAHFRKISSANDVSELPAMQHDDVLVFRKTNSGELTHSGRVRWHGDTQMLLSKLGEHPAAITSIQAIVDEYQGQFDALEVYRISEN